MLFRAHTCNYQCRSRELLDTHHNNSMQGIEPVKTTLYHIERMHECHISMHATLESMFRKTHAQGLDWMGKIPFALVVLWQMPCQPIHCVQPL